jgi:hypothetical protein
MGNGTGGQDLFFKLLDKPPIPGIFRSDEFKRDRDVQVQIFGFINTTHSTTADLLNDAVATFEAIAGFEIDRVIGIGVFAVKRERLLFFFQWSAAFVTEIAVFGVECETLGTKNGNFEAPSGLI